MHYYLKNLSDEQLIQKEIFEDIVLNKIFIDLKPAITERLIHLLEKGNEMYDGFEKVGALNFEIDSPLEMNYIGYPFYLFDHNWVNNYQIDVRVKEKYDIYRKLYSDFAEDQNMTEDEFGAFGHIPTYDAEMKNFSHCWQEAKKITNSDKLCYINIHDSRGFSCESALPFQEVQFEALVNETFNLS